MAIWRVEGTRTGETIGFDSEANPPSIFVRQQPSFQR